MADNRLNQAARERLQAVLAAYGADPARWPDGDRELAAWLAGADPDLVQEARTLDSVLARASEPVAPAGAMQRLIASADDEPGNVVSLAPRSRPQPRSKQSALPGRFAVLTALAASLALGLYLGASGQADWLTSPLLAEESPEYLSAELHVLDGTLELFEDNMEP